MNAEQAEKKNPYIRRFRNRIYATALDGLASDADPRDWDDAEATLRHLIERDLRNTNNLILVVKALMESEHT